MLDLRIGNKSLQLPPGATMEVEENNPYLQLNEEVKGENSWPMTIKATPVNTEALDYVTIPQKRINQAGKEGSCFDGNFQLSLGKIMIEKVRHDLNRPENGDISIYYLSGTSYFWQDLKGKNLRDIDMGGEQSFAWDNYNRAGAGFWGHIHKVVDAAPGTYPYCFYSALVDSWQWYDTFRGGALINPMLQVGGKPTFEQYKITSFLTGYAPSAIVPQIFLRPVLEKAVALAGWKLEGDILSDPQFNLICLCTLRAINWVSGTHTAKPQITFNLADHLPAITVSKLLMALRNRFGWWYDVDRVNKIVRIRELKTVGVTNRKDMTRKASPVVTKTILEEQKIYGVHNSAGSSKLSLDGYEYKGELNVKGLLPAPSQAVSGHVYLVKMENNYYVCEGGENNVFTWEILSANTGDAVPDGATEEIRGDSLVSPIKQQYGIYGEYFPFIEGAVYWPTANDDQQANDIQLCFYYGIRNDFNNRPWPFASHHIYDAKALQVGTWSLALLAKDYAGNDIGLYHRNWKPFLDRLIAQEECEVELSLTRQEFMEMKFSDELIVDGMSYYVAKRKYVLPAKKGILRVVCECNRI